MRDTVFGGDTQSMSLILYGAAVPHIQLLNTFKPSQNIGYNTLFFMVFYRFKRRFMTTLTWLDLNQ